VRVADDARFLSPVVVGLLLLLLLLLWLVVVVAAVVVIVVGSTKQWLVVVLKQWTCRGRSQGHRCGWRGFKALLRRLPAVMWCICPPQRMRITERHATPRYTRHAVVPRHAVACRHRPGERGFRDAAAVRRYIRHGLGVEQDDGRHAPAGKPRAHDEAVVPAAALRLHRERAVPQALCRVFCASLGLCVRA
jgi:hypothetical protein